MCVWMGLELVFTEYCEALFNQFIFYSNRKELKRAENLTMLFFYLKTFILFSIVNSQVYRIIQ